MVFLSGIVVLLPKAASVTGKCCSASTYTILVFGLSQNYEYFLLPLLLGMHKRAKQNTRKSSQNLTVIKLTFPSRTMGSPQIWACLRRWSSSSTSKQEGVTPTSYIIYALSHLNPPSRKNNSCMLRMPMFNIAISGLNQKICFLPSRTIEMRG